MTKVLAADVGGTKTLLALLELNGEGFGFVRQERYESRKYPGLLPIVKEFVGSLGPAVKIAGACFAIAGPVKDGVSETPNLPWLIRASELADKLDLPGVKLINDFAAVGWGIPHLGSADLATLQAGSPEPRGSIGYLGAGTGLGQGFMVWNEAVGGHDVLPSEGGHGDFAARDEIEIAIFQHLSRRFGRVSYERVVSGIGLVNIYRALVEEVGRPEAPSVRADMEREEPAAVISGRGLAGSDATCAEALDRFIAIYGAEAGNLALRVLATGGLYVAGGVAPRIVERLRQGGFMRAFNDKGRLSGLTSAIPVHVVLNTQVGLLGAAACAARGLKKG